MGARLSTPAANQAERKGLLGGHRRLEWLVTALLFGGSLLLYSLTLSRLPFPGLPVQTLLLHLEPGPVPALLDPIWGAFLRGLSTFLPNLSVAGASAFFAAICGAAVVTLLARILFRVPYRLPPDNLPVQRKREAQARLIVGVVAALYVGVSIPFWVAATRSLPATFHLLWLLVVVVLFAGFQRDGRTWRLGVMGFLWGVGLLEFATLIVLTPIALFFVLRHLLMQKRLGSVRDHAALWGGAGMGVLAYPLQAWWLYRSGSAGLTSLGNAWMRVLAAQYHLILYLRASPGALVILFFCIAPWLLLFVFSRRSPWYYEAQQIVVRVLFSMGLLAILFDAPFSPWSFLGMAHLLVTPYLLFAIYVGYMAGEFWIMGQPPPPDSTQGQRWAHKLATFGAGLIPLAIVCGGVANRRAADGRPSAVIQHVARDTLARAGNRDVLFSATALDASLQWAARELHKPMRFIQVYHTSSPLYLDYLKTQFPEPEWEPFWQVGQFGLFVESWMRGRGHPAQTAVIGIPEAFQHFGSLLPNGLLYSVWSELEDIDLEFGLAQQIGFWQQVGQLAARPVSTANPASYYHQHLRRLTSQSANNFGVMLANNNQTNQALRAFQAAHQMWPDNISVLLNLVSYYLECPAPEQTHWDEEWALRQQKLTGEEWQLAFQYGTLWRARDWLEKGYPWALSGEPEVQTPALLERTLADPGESSIAQLMDQIFMQIGQPGYNVWRARAALARNQKNNPALLELARAALRNNDAPAAQANYLAALANGLPPEALHLDFALLRWLQGEPEVAVEALRSRAQQVLHDARVWLALLLISERYSPIQEMAFQQLRNNFRSQVPVRLVLAWECLTRHEWAAAETELETILHRDPRNQYAWEMIFTLAHIRADMAALETAKKMLLAQTPAHPLMNLQQAWVTSHQEPAENTAMIISQAAQQNRHPIYLNALANLWMDTPTGSVVAQSLIDEALRCEPFNPIFLQTDVECKLKSGQVEDARHAVERLVTSFPDYHDGKLLAARIMTITDEPAAVRSLLEELQQQWPKLTPRQRQRWQVLNRQYNANND